MSWCGRCLLLEVMTVTCSCMAWSLMSYNSVRCENSDTNYGVSLKNCSKGIFVGPTVL